MNSAICRILAGRLVTIRATTLNYDTLRPRQTYTDIYRNARLERFWEHGENRGYLHEIYYDVQNKRLIVMISAFQALALVHRLNSGNLRLHRGAPTNTRLDVRQSIRCNVGRIDTLTQSALPMNYRIIFNDVSPTFTIRWDALSNGCVELIIDLRKSGRDVPCQS
jgi:hypothetical protein